MIGARRILATGLSALLALGPVSARAAELARGLDAGISAPAPIFVLPAPVAAASLSLSLSPAASAAPLAPIPPAAAPLAAIPAPVAPAAAATAAAPQAELSARSALTELSAPTAAPAPGGVFDGAGLPAAARDDEPVRAGEAVPPAAPLAGPAARPKTPRPRSTAGRFLGAAAVGAGASALAPWLWSAVPGMGALILFAVAAAPIAGAAAALLAVRGARAAYRRLSGSGPASAPPAPSRGRVRALRAAGFALGVALAAATAVEQSPLLVGYHAYLDSRRPAAERVIETPVPGTRFAAEAERVLALSADGRAALDRVRGSDGKPRMPAFIVTERRQPYVALPGTGFADAAVRLLSENPEGMKVLDGLRDRGGVIHMPTFYVSDQEGSAAYYAPPDSVTLNARTIEYGGVTVDEFLRDPRAQQAYLEREQAVITHELKHATQARRSPFNADTWIFARTNAGRIVAAVEAFAHPPAAAEPNAKSAVPAPAPLRPAPASVTAAPVSIDAAELARSGITVRRFLNDAPLQKAYIVGHQVELARALRPLPAASAAPAAAAAKTAAAARPAFRVEIGNISEWEYEAYFTEHFYTHERLKADPAADIAVGELNEYVQDLVPFDDFLGRIDGEKLYAANFRAGSAYYAHYMADMRARWDAHRVEANVLLARRSLALRAPAAARAYMVEARRIAAEKGLPKPSLSGN